MRSESGTIGMLKWVVVAFLFCPLARGGDLSAALDQAIRKLTSSLAPASLHLPEPTGDLVTPPEIQAAGADFIGAWRIWARVMPPSPSDNNRIAVPERKDLINAATEWESFHILLKRSFDADPPPDLAEFGRFTYSSLDWCGDSGMSFSRLYEKGLSLTLLREGKYFEALKRMAEGRAEVVAPLMRAFGVDGEEFRIGAWLNKALNTGDLCEAGGELTAQMLMDWIDLRWALELQRYQKRIATHRYETYNEPDFPNYQIVRFLRPESGVTDETKARIAKFIETRGLEMFPVKTCIYTCPKGAEKWLVPLAQKGLSDELNRVRVRSSRVLAVAGVYHDKPETLPAPRFSATFNGLPWPGNLYKSKGQGPGFAIELLTKNGTSKSA